MNPEYHIIRGAWATWHELFTTAADVATQAGPGNLIGISHSEDAGESVITVWNWIGREHGPERQARFEVFRGAWSSWQTLFDDAARYIATLGPERLIGVSHSEGKDEGLVAVWYWE